VGCRTSKWSEWEANRSFWSKHNPIFLPQSYCAHFWQLRNLSQYCTRKISSTTWLWTRKAHADCCTSYRMIKHNSNSEIIENCLFEMIWKLITESGSTDGPLKFERPNLQINTLLWITSCSLRNRNTVFYYDMKSRHSCFWLQCSFDWSTIGRWDMI